jgi:Peptidase family M23
VRNEVYLNVPASSKIKVSLTCSGFSDPATVTLDLIPYTNPTGEGSLILPFAPYDLDSGEYLITSAQHWANGGANGTQIFAHDISIQAKSGSDWSSLLSGKDNSKNAHHRIYGKPVRAIAYGTVVSWENTIDENPKPGEKLEDVPKEGNHFWIKYGNIKVLYAHLQKGSLPSALLKKDAAVKAGQQSGLAGNSGNSGGPHLHLEGRDSSTNTLRGLAFKNGWVLEPEKIASNHSGPWVRLPWRIVRHEIRSSPDVGSKTRLFFSAFAGTFASSSAIEISSRS